MLWVYDHYIFFNSFSARMSESDVYGRQNLTSKDGPRAERVKQLCDYFLCKICKYHTRNAYSGMVWSFRTREYPNFILRFLCKWLLLSHFSIKSTCIS